MAHVLLRALNSSAIPLAALPDRESRCVPAIAWHTGAQVESVGHFAASENFRCHAKYCSRSNLRKKSEWHLPRPNLIT